MRRPTRETVDFALTEFALILIIVALVYLQQATERGIW